MKKSGASQGQSASELISKRMAELGEKVGPVHGGNPLDFAFFEGFDLPW